MSYDLTFWKQNSTCNQAPSQIYSQLLEGRVVDGLDTISIIEIIHRIRQHFPGIITDGGLTFWEGGTRGMFELYSSPQHLHVCCREMSGDDMNALIDVAAEYECPLYDPQKNRRYDGT